MIKVAQSDILNNFQIYISNDDFINSLITNHSKEINIIIENYDFSVFYLQKQIEKMLPRQSILNYLKRGWKRKLIINSLLQNKMKKKESKQYKVSSNKNGFSSTRLPAINQKKALVQSNTLNINVSSYQDEGLITLIQEYLLKNNLFDTLQAFQRDCLKGFKQSIKSVDSLKKELLQSFDCGNRDVFEVRFRQYVPLSMRNKDSKTLRMQFYLELYFFIYTIHPYLGRKKIIDSTSKQHFISFLQGRGALLCTQQEFLPFYALAYVPKPQQHQTFKSIFTKNWITNLKKQFNLFLQKLYPNTKTPLLVNIYDKFIQINLQLEKYSSAALTEPDQELDDNIMIQQQIQQNLQQSIIHDPQPVLLENNNTNKILSNSNKILNNSTKIINNSLDKIQKPLKQLQNLSNSLNNKSSELLQQKQLKQLIQLRQRANQFEDQRNGLLSYIETMKKKYQSLQNDFKENFESIKIILQDSQNKWFRLIQEIYNVALDVYNAAILLSNGMPLSDPQLLAKRGEKLQKYKGFVSMNIEDLLSDNIVDYSFFERPENDLSMDLVKKNNEYMERERGLIEIDFDKVKGILGKIPDQQMSESDVAELQFEKCLILQALRWRMTKVRGAPLKREVVLSYTIFDVLEIAISNQKGNKSIVNILLNSQNQTLLHQITLFISALGMDYYGREYLFNKQLMVNMMRLRKMPNLSQLIKGIILVIFQMLSNKRACQVVMIENGLMEEIVEVLDKERDQMAPFIMQYTTALLLNLLLNKKGLDRAENIRSQILMTLINLMETQHPSVKSFIHASLYPLLARKVFRQKALEFGMQENIKYLLENNPSVEVEHQLRYVYNRLMMEEDVQEDKQDDPEYDEINDQEIGEDAQLVSEDISSPLSGEHLLIKKYALIGPSAMEQTVQLKEETKDTFSKAIYYDRDLYERFSVQTPLLGKGGRKSQILLDKGYTNNNSVYSSKSSNRILLSEKNSRIKNLPQHFDKPKTQTISQRHSLQPTKQFRQHSKQQARNTNKPLLNLLDNTFEETKEKINKQNKIQVQKEQETFRRIDHGDSPLKEPSLNEMDEQQIPINQNAKIINPIDIEHNQSATQKLNKQKEEQANLRNRKLKPYQKGDEYLNAFQARSQLVRTPPQKPT